MKRISLSNPLPEGLDLDYHDENMVLMDNIPEIALVQEKCLNHAFILVSIVEGECSLFVDNEELKLSSTTC